MKRSLVNSAIWRTGFDLAKKEQKIKALEEEARRPEFWGSPNSAKASIELTRLKKEIDFFAQTRKDIEALENIIGEFKEADDAAMILGEIEKIEEAVHGKELEMYFSGPYDEDKATLSFYSGAGGVDAEDWTAILMRMYVRFAEKRGWRVSTIHLHQNDQSGLKNATIQITGKYVYGWLKKESGVHRLVRISPFSAAKLRHTSFAFVEVLPEIPAESIALKDEDVEFETFRSSGPGGQNVNKRETAVRVIHKQTGISVSVQTERSQAQNKISALAILRAKLYTIMEEKRLKEISEIKGEKVAIEWGRQIRSYVLHPYKMIKDHRTGYETSKVEQVLEGDLDEILKAELRLLQ